MSSSEANIQPAVKAGGMRISQADHPHVVHNGAHTVPLQTGVTTALEPTPTLSSSPQEKKHGREHEHIHQQQHAPTRQASHAPKAHNIQQPR